MRQWSRWTKPPHPARASFSLTCALPSNMRLGAPKPWACEWCACGLAWCWGMGVAPTRCKRRPHAWAWALYWGMVAMPAPWVHLADAVGSVRFAMAHPHLQGPVNTVAPEAVTQATFARALAASFGRRAWLRMPGLPLRVLLGEMSSLLLEGQNPVPSAALARGYRFVHPRLSGALADLAETERPEVSLPAAEY